MKTLIIAISAVLLLASCRILNADIVFSESFDVTASNESEFTTNYPNFQIVLGSADVWVPPTNRLQIAGTTESQIQLVGVPEWHEIELDIGRISGSGSPVQGNVGIRIGDNNVVFHPGLDNSSGFPDGSLRVEGPGGFGNQDVGFVPDPGVLHTLSVVADGTGNFTVSLTDANDATNVFSKSWFNSGAVNGQIKLRHIDVTAAGHTALFDNIQVVGVPEPNSIIMIIAGLITICCVRRKSAVA